MQPIILLGVAVAAVALVGTGFLSGNQPWNQFEVWVQQLGWATNTIESPISHATIDLEVKKFLNEDDPENPFYENIIDQCSFHSAEDIPGVANTPGARNGVIICKILGENGNAIAEGREVIDALKGYSNSDILFIDIDQCALLLDENGLPDPTGENESDPHCLDVMAPIHGVKLVVEAPIGQMN